MRLEKPPMTNLKFKLVPGGGVGLKGIAVGNLKQEPQDEKLTSNLSTDPGSPLGP